MDLVLLEPGDQDIVKDDCLIDNKWKIPFVASMKKCIELLSINYNMKQQMTTNVSNSARTSGRPNLSDITCIKYVDSSSPFFYKYCLSASPIDKLKHDEDDGGDPSKIYILRNSGDLTSNIITLELRNAMISAIEFQSHPNDMPTEQFQLNFTDIQWTYHNQYSNATHPGMVAYGWSVRRNRPMDAHMSGMTESGY